LRNPAVRALSLLLALQQCMKFFGKPAMDRRRKRFPLLLEASTQEVIRHLQAVQGEKLKPLARTLQGVQIYGGL
jgi:hypothetical protein